jgi:hypothetical protein
MYLDGGNKVSSFPFGGFLVDLFLRPRGEPRKRFVNEFPKGEKVSGRVRSKRRKPASVGPLRKPSRQLSSRD